MQEPREPLVRRYEDQRWVLDNIIRANGPEWDQPRLQSMAAALGPEAAGDIGAIRARISKLADISPALEQAARKRVRRAEAAEAADEPVTARESWFMAANFFAAAQWSLDAVTERHLALNTAKRDAYMAYARLADHHVEAVWVPFRGAALPAWLHLPAGVGGKLPCVVSIPGMDGFKERSVALYGDPLLARGIAVLSIEGPGQYEAATLGIHASADAWSEAGTACFEYLAARSEIDAGRIAISGRSFGTLFATIALAHEARFCAGAILATCLEPGCQTIFEQASPTYKKRFMWMAGVTEEEDFEPIKRALTWVGHAERITAPFLCVAGGDDELSPLRHTEDMMGVLRGPKQLVIYEGSRHTVGGVPSTANGPSPPQLLANWLAARLTGKAMSSARWWVDGGGAVGITPY